MLHLSSPEANKGISLVLQCCRDSTQPYRHVGSLLEDENWRPHLVAAVALAALGYDEGTFKKLWNAIDGGSWVTPQLAVAAFLRDPGFSEQVRLRIQSRCPLIGERHIRAGAEVSAVRSAKMAASLIQLVKELPQPPDWLAKELSEPDLLALVCKDIDHSDQIAKGWHTALTKLLSAEGIVFV